MKNFCLNTWSRTGLAAVAALALNACAPGQDAPTPTVGTINVSRYLAVGDSYTAGLSAGGLTLASQQYSYPNLLAQQLQGAQPGATFSQPLLAAGAGTGYFDLAGFSTLGFPRTRRVPGPAVRRQVINPAACGGADTVRLFTRTDAPNNLPQNLGVPGLRLAQLNVANLGNETSATPTGAFNPYFERILPANDSRTYLRVVTDAAASATFFTYFLGLDDLMPYVRSGGQCGTAPNSTLTNQLRTNAKTLLDVLTAGGRPGIIASLPDLNTLPLLRTGRGFSLQKRLQDSYHDNALLYIEDPFGSGVGQPITNDDYVLATTLPRIGQLTPVVVGGSTLMLPYGRDERNPLRDADVMDYDEMNRVSGVLSSYNNELNRLARDVYKMPSLNTSPLPYLLDTSGVMPGYVGESISVGGVQYSAEPVRGNFFSLDYYSLTPRGNALLANAFISALNRAYNAKIPAIDTNSLPSVAQ
ncbi:hypothetical protein [Hymenobacter properus]|uniref:G-D-S-L family lipolytic protein n=1 Tax=Hymenobacter properus TaxID=2791026 RepID=A0A931FIM0_9BACT|nr:hypothetical protein [Hymenobacter properus]MBF9142152.1 hypothetical protein [Hymenobacter properus]MBR7720959.1 hypothetical protein [Microvirga sp. SRT04]